METVCCGVSLRVAALILLCMNLGFNLFELWSGLNERSTYKNFFEHNPTFIFLDLCLLVVGALVFLAAITVIKSSRKSAIILLNASILVLLFDMFFLFYTIILLNYSNDSMGKILDITSPGVFVVYVVILATMAFKFYSAWVFHNCRVELKRNSFCTDFYSDKDAYTTGPAAYGENFQYAAPLLKFALYLSKCIYG